MQNNKSLNAIYAKDRPEGMKVNKTFLIPKGLVYIEEGFNIREIDQEHVASFETSYREGIAVPALVVEPTDKGFKVIEGHHRKLAVDNVDEVTHVECKDNTGASEAQTLILMVASSQGKNLQPMERARAYERMLKLGMTEKDIQTKLNRSRKDVSNYLALLSAPPRIVEAIEDGRIGYAAAIEELNRNPEGGEQKIIDALYEAKETGKKVTRATLKGDAEPKKGLTKAEINRVLELVSELPQAKLPEELCVLIDKYNGIE